MDNAHVAPGCEQFEHVGKILTEADALADLADLAGTPRPDNPSVPVEWAPDHRGPPAGLTERRRGKKDTRPNPVNRRK